MNDERFMKPFDEIMQKVAVIDARMIVAAAQLDLGSLLGAELAEKLNYIIQVTPIGGSVKVDDSVVLQKRNFDYEIL